MRPSVPFPVGAYTLSSCAIVGVMGSGVSIFVFRGGASVHIRSEVVVGVQGWEQEVTGQTSMTLAEYYEVVFGSFGFSRADIQTAVQQVGTEDYHRIVEYLHSRTTTPCSHTAPGNFVADLAPPPSPMPSSMQTTPLTTPLSSAAASNVSSKCMYTTTNQ